MCGFDISGAKFIGVCGDKDARAPQFKRKFTVKENVKHAALYVTAYGVYDAKVNGERVSWFMAPGWTSYKKRLQVQEYDVTDKLNTAGENEITVVVGDGWAMSPLGGSPGLVWAKKPSVAAKLVIEYIDGSTEELMTDGKWEYAYGPYLETRLYAGETYDATKKFENFKPAAVYEELGLENLIEQQGEIVSEVCSFEPKKIFKTPKGETVIDFGQNITGVLEFTVQGKAGERVYITCAEVLDAEGNFYNANYRSARSAFEFICDGEKHTHRPRLNFYGFRYVRLDEFPSEEICECNFKAYAMSSQTERTGNFECSSDMVNQLFSNIIWGQLDNYLDVPTDCPQRDERLGWTGDAQAFVRTGSYNFDVEKFFTKWLADLAADQFENGGINIVIPSLSEEYHPGMEAGACGWADAATIVPWQIYLTYGNTEILKKQFNSMYRWTECVRSFEKDGLHLWQHGRHYGDWLALDAGDGEYVGKTDVFYIASAFYANSVLLVIKAYRAIVKNDPDFDFGGFDIADYENLYKGIVSDFKKVYMEDNVLPKQKTQTAHVLALYFDLTDDKAKCAAALAKMVEDNGKALQTGFLGTPYLLHALSDNGYANLAYDLLLREEYPSWLFSVKRGATTVWEHWDGQKEDGSFWSTDMNSFNHYAYGAVGDWLYGVCLGINTDEDEPGFKKVHIRPQLCERLEFAKGGITTRNGRINVEWTRSEGGKRLCVNIPEGMSGDIVFEGEFTEFENGGEFVFEK